MAKKNTIPWNIVIILILVIGVLSFTGNLPFTVSGFTLTSLSEVSVSTQDPWYGSSSSGKTFYATGTLQPLGEELQYSIGSGKVNNANTVVSDTFKITTTNSKETCFYPAVTTNYKIRKYSSEHKTIFDIGYGQSTCEAKGGIYTQSPGGFDKWCLYPSTTEYLTAQFQGKRVEFSSILQLYQNNNLVQSKTFSSNNQQVALGDNAIVIFTGSTLSSRLQCPEYSNVPVIYDDGLNQYKTMTTTFAVDNYKNKISNLQSNFNSCFNTIVVNDITNCVNNLRNDINTKVSSVGNSIGQPQIALWQTATQYQSGSESGYKVPLDAPNWSYIPTFNIRLNADKVNFFIPFREPDVISCEGEGSILGGKNYLNIRIKNIGTEAGTFSGSLKSCPGVLPESPTVYTSSLEPNQETTIRYGLFENTNEAIDQNCNFEVVNPSNPNLSDSISCNIIFEDTCVVECSLPFELNEETCSCECTLTEQVGKRINEFECIYEDIEHTPSELEIPEEIIEGAGSFFDDIGQGLNDFFGGLGTNLTLIAWILIGVAALVIILIVFK